MGIKIKSRRANPYEALPWMGFARGFLGVREIKGRLHNDQILRMFALSGFPGIKDDETAWCAAYVGACLVLAGIEPSHSLAARSYEAWGEPLDAPLFGCVGVKRRSNPNAPSWQGHVGFVVAASRDWIYLLGGNQNNSVSIARYPRAEFTAFRWPEGFDVPQPPLPLPTSKAGADRYAAEA